MKSSIKKILTSAVLIAAPGFALADADIAVQTGGAATQATANVDICVVIPEILIFGVGEVGDVISKIQWTASSAAGVVDMNNQTYNGAPAPFTAPAPFSTTIDSDVTVGPTGSVSGPGLAEVSLPVFLFSNGGDVTITVDITGGVGGGGTPDVLVGLDAGTIPIAEITSGGGSISHPVLLSGNSALTAAAANGVVNLGDDWTYEYTPASIPAADTYSARITYVAAQP